MNHTYAMEEHYRDEASHEDYTQEAYASTRIDSVYEAYCDYCMDLEEGEEVITYEQFKKQSIQP